MVAECYINPRQILRQLAIGENTLNFIVLPGTRNAYYPLATSKITWLISFELFGSSSVAY